MEQNRTNSADQLIPGPVYEYPTERALDLFLLEQELRLAETEASISGIGLHQTKMHERGGLARMRLYDAVRNELRLDAAVFEGLATLLIDWSENPLKPTVRLVYHAPRGIDPPAQEAQNPPPETAANALDSLVERTKQTLTDPTLEGVALPGSWPVGQA